MQALHRLSTHDGQLTDTLCLRGTGPDPLLLDQSLATKPVLPFCHHAVGKIDSLVGLALGLDRPAV